MSCLGISEPVKFAEYSVSAQLVILGDFGVCGSEPFGVSAIGGGWLWTIREIVRIIAGKMTDGVRA